MRFVKESIIEAAPERVFAFHTLPDAMRRLIPPNESASVIKTADISKIGDRAIVEVKIFGLISVRWVAEHTAYEPPSMFEDIQIAGPFKSWRHRHIVEPHDEGSLLRDDVEYEPPMWFLGNLAAPFAVEPRLRSMFDYRHEVTRKWCESHQ